MGWNFVTSSNDDEAFNFSKQSHAAHGDRYARADEFAQVFAAYGIAGRTTRFFTISSLAVFSTRPAAGARASMGLIGLDHTH